MKLFVGLGNPGTEHASNRHNVGFMALDAIAQAANLPAWRKRFSGLVTEGRLGGEKVLLLKPQTFMNVSGQSAGEAARYYKLDVGDIVVFHDELDLAPGKVRVKTGGGVAGHNGLKSMTAHLGNDYQRVRIGIGHPGERERVVGHVLHDFSKADEDWLTPLLEAIASASPLLAEGAKDKFQTQVAHAMQSDAQETKSGSRVKPSTAKPQSKGPSAVNDGGTTKSGPLASALRRWFES